MSSPRLVQAVIAVGLAGLVLSACSSQPTEPAQSEASSSTASAAQTTKNDDDTFSPVTIKNCGVDVTVDTKPERIITLNQGATESLLALHAEKQMIGTAYLDDEIDPSVAEAYKSIPVLAEKYPSHEQVVDKRPQLLAASYASAFSDKAVGSREELQKLGIATYLDPFACEDKSQRPKAEWSSIQNSLKDLGQLTGTMGEAQAIITHIDEVVATAQKNKVGEGKTVFWWDSKTDAPFAGAGQGGPQLLLDTVGAKNVFGDLEGNWADVSWEAVLKANPDYIVVADASWDTAQAKIDFAHQDPSLRELEAVKHDRFIVVPFSESTPNVRTIDAVERLNEGLSK